LDSWRYIGGAGTLRRSWIGGDDVAKSKNKQKVKRHQHAMRRKRRLKRKKLAAQAEN
jgi:hypothetical protein